MTQTPSPQTQAVVDEMRKYEPRAMITQAPVVWEHAEGHRVVDADGRSYLDFSSGIIVANVGHAHPHLVAALQGMLDQKLLHSYLYATRIRTRLARKLVEATAPNLTKACLLSTGTESIEAAMKISRLHGMSVHSRKSVLVSHTDNYHGRTMGAQMLSSNMKSKNWISNLDPDIVHLPFPYEDRGEEAVHRDLAALADGGVDLDRIAAFFLESYQGVHGPTFYPKAYVQALRRWADDHDALLVFDDIQAGFGRTGKLLCYEHYDVQASLVCCGKGLSGCLPISAVLGPAELLDLPEEGEMTSTHSGNPMCCAAALATLEILEKENLVEESARRGGIIEERFEAIAAKHPDRVAKISGRGMVYSIYFVDPSTGEPDVAMGSRITERAIDNGLMLYLTHCDMVKLTPPLSMPDDALREGLDVLARTVDECVAERAIRRGS